MDFYQTKLNNDNIRLINKFSVSNTMCDNPQHYEEYLRFNALYDIESGLGITYLYINDDDIENEKIVGYITLRTSSFIKDSGEFKKYGYPALEISELAVHKDYVCKGIGSDMVMTAINTANEMNESASIKYVVLCSDPKAEKFYKKLHFNSMNNEYEEIPREHFNVNCVPMYLKLR